MSKKKKIAHVITRLIVGGAQENTLFTVEGLAQNPDYEITLITGGEKGPEGSLFESGWQESVKLELVPHLKRNLNPLSDWRAYCELVKLFKREQYDLVHTHSSKAGVIGRLAAHKAGVPIIVHTIHGLPFHPYQSWLANKLYIAAEKYAARVTHKILSVADNMSQKAIEAGVAEPDMFATVYSGMDLDSFINSPALREQTRAELGIASEDELIVGKVARLFNLKGHENLFEAAPEILKAVPNVRFLIVGDGILRDQYEAELKQKGIYDKFIFTGLVDPKRIPAMISALDVLVHVSLREGLAKVLPQALAGGKPVVSFDLDGAPEMVRNDQTGYLVHPGDKQRLVDVVVDLLKDPDKRKRMGAAGRKLVDPIYRKEYMVQQIDQCYRDLGL